MPTPTIEKLKEEIISKINLWSGNDIECSSEVSVFDRFCNLSQLKWAIEQSSGKTTEEIYQWLKIEIHRAGAPIQIVEEFEKEFLKNSKRG